MRSTGDQRIIFLTLADSIIGTQCFPSRARTRESTFSPNKRGERERVRDEVNSWILPIGLRCSARVHSRFVKIDDTSERATYFAKTRFRVRKSLRIGDRKGNDLSIDVSFP